MTPVTPGIPIWVYLLSVALSGGFAAAVLQYLTHRATARSQASTAGSENRLRDVQALSSALTALQGENGRLSERLEECSVELDVAYDRIRDLQGGAGP